MRFSQAREGLPTLGVGASLSFGASPDPVALAQLQGGPSFIEYAGAVQHSFMQKPLAQLERLRVPVLYHPSCLNLWGSVPNPRPWLDAVNAHVRAVKSAWLAQDVALCFASAECPGYSIQLGYFIAPILTATTLREAARRVEEVVAAMDVPLLLEPAPVTFQLGEMDIFTWLGALAEMTDCGLLLDAGHVVSHQLARGASSLLEGLERLDLSRVVELHVAGGVIKRSGARQHYVDAHDLPILPETWQVFEHLLERTPSLRAVCVECEGSMAHSVLPVLEQTRRAVSRGTINDALRTKVDAERGAP
ncbi:MAG: DUF692 family protein [Archangium sp.]|nr:DUF692 family protein [Archangium sp.]